MQQYIHNNKGIYMNHVQKYNNFRKPAMKRTGLSTLRQNTSCMFFDKSTGEPVAEMHGTILYLCKTKTVVPNLTASTEVNGKRTIWFNDYPTSNMAFEQISRLGRKSFRSLAAHIEKTCIHKEY